jgi:hypothetical protein
MLALSTSVGFNARQAAHRGPPVSSIILFFRAVPGSTGTSPHSQRE